MKYCVINFYLYLVAEVSCWKFFTSLSDLALNSSLRAQEPMHSDYYFGNCKVLGSVLYDHKHYNHKELLGKVIVRGWLKVSTIPTCIILRGILNDEDLFRSTAYALQICVSRMTFCHTRQLFKYYYYEWYIPLDVISGMDWDIYFYGPDSM